MTRLLYIVTDSLSADVLLRGQLRFMVEQGFDVHVISAPSSTLERVSQREGVSVAAVPMTRAISPTKDLVALGRLVAAVRRIRPTIVVASTPKGGLLGSIAARMCAVPVRVYLLRGLRYETATGSRRALLKTTEKVACACAHEVLCVSPSLQKILVGEGLCPADKTVVLGEGSSNGVDVRRFSQSVDPGRVRSALGLSTQDRVIGFVGRLSKDKGVDDLLTAYACAKATHPELRLLLVGDFDDSDPLAEGTKMRTAADPSIVITGMVEDTAPYYQLMELLVFPSYREGFPNVPLEAAAAGLPTVGYRATGTVDAVVDGVTGTLSDVGDVHGLTTAVQSYLHDESLRRSHGQAAYRRAADTFERRKVWSELATHYKSLAADYR